MGETKKLRSPPFPSLPLSPPCPLAESSTAGVGVILPQNECLSKGLGSKLLLSPLRNLLWILWLIHTPFHMMNWQVTFKSFLSWPKAWSFTIYLLRVDLATGSLHTHEKLALLCQLWIPYYEFNIFSSSHFLCLQVIILYL